MVPWKKLKQVKYGLCLLGWMGCSLSALGQEDLQQVLQQVSKNNLFLKASRQETDAQKAEWHTEITPEDPKVAFGYAPGINDSEKHKETFSVSQGFDFPTLYHHRKKLADGKASQSELAFRLSIQEVMMETQKCFYQMAFLSKREQYLAERAENAKKLYESLKTKLNEGEVTILEVNKAHAQMLELENQRRLNQAEKESQMKKLQWLNGGEMVDVARYEYVPSAIVPMDSLYREYVAYSPEVLLQNQEKVNAGREVKVRKAQWLPKFELAYESEKTPGEGFHGPKVGMTVPLWANRNKVKMSKARLAAVENSHEDFLEKTRFELFRLRETALAHEEAFKAYRENVEAITSTHLLEKALELGQISVIEYFTESNYYIEVYERYLEAERDYFLALTDLYKFRY